MNKADSQTYLHPDESKISIEKFRNVENTVSKTHQEPNLLLIEENCQLVNRVTSFENREPISIVIRVIGK